MLWGGADIGGQLELRRDNSGATRLRGTFPYGVPAILSDGGRTGKPQKEVIGPRAFAYRVDSPDEDIHLLVGHDYDRPLASRGTGTLILRDTPAALSFTATISREIGDTTYGRDALAMIAAGLDVGISPGFRIPPERAVPRDQAEEVTEEPNDGKLDAQGQPQRGAIIRTVKQALLYELSVVTRPAYPKAQVEARSWAPGYQDANLHLSHPLKRWRL